MTSGTRLADFPTDVRVGPEGAAVFEVTGGQDALPLIVRGFSDYKAPLLFEFGGQWNFLDQQVRGNDWYQAFRDPDGSCGAVFIVKTRSGQKHRYFAGQATGEAEVTGITQVNGEVRVTAARPASDRQPAGVPRFHAARHRRLGGRGGRGRGARSRLTARLAAR